VDPAKGLDVGVADGADDDIGNYFGAHVQRD
jgi:hypothetical protein